MSESPRSRDAQAYHEDEYRRLFDSSLHAIFVSNGDDHLIDINPVGVRLFGFESKQDMLSLDVASTLCWNPGDRKRTLAKLLSGETADASESVFKTRSGERIRVRETISAIYGDDGRLASAQSILSDETELRRLEKQLLLAQKAGAVGRLVEGVSHDFNNLLTAINGYSELILVQIADDDPLRAGVLEIRQAGQRAADLTRRLLTLSRQQIASPRVTGLNRVVRDLEKLLARVIGESIEIEISLEPDLPTLLADVSQLEQIVLNLAINAQDSIDGSGRVTLGTSLVRRPGPLRGYVELSVNDSGLPMSTELRTTLTEPLRAGHSKLGLAVVNRIVRDNGGQVAVESEPGQGNTVRLFFPPAKETVDSFDLVPESTPRGLPRGTETVLLVEDEATVRDLVQRVLESQGYRVLPARSADEALAACERLTDPLDLLLTDIVMPQTPGPVLAEHLQELYPDLKVLFISGYSDSHEGIRLLGERRAAFLAKPFSPGTLAYKVRDFLDDGLIPDGSPDYSGA